MAKGKSSSANQRKKYEEYKQQHTREKNKVRKLKKLLTNQPDNSILVEQINRLEAVINKK